jgi:hypothetical protein
MRRSANNQGSANRDTSNSAPVIYLALTDDWELRGNGSGNIAELQFTPMRELQRIFQEHGARTTFNAELMQQLTFRKLQAKHPELGRLADEWDGHVREAFTKGQDIQLHIHPQWSRAEYADGSWKLSGDWSLPNHTEETAYTMLAAGKTYLEELLRPIDPAYKCLSFRSGSSSIAPSEFALRLLAKLGIVFDMSIVGGLRVNTRHLDIDYRNCDEISLPFYPTMTDARRVSHKSEPIVCVPIFSFTLSRRHATRQTFGKIAVKASRKFAAQASGKQTIDAYEDWAEIGQSSVLARAYHQAVKPCLYGKHMVADIGKLDYHALTQMLAAIRARARAFGMRQLPVILTNHSKDIQDFSHIERFVKDLAKAPDIRFATLTDVARGLQSGEFSIRKTEA